MLEEWILALAASPFVYLALYLFATIDGFFPPMPSESAVIALAAVAMSTGAPNLWVILAVAAAGAFTGDQIAYAIGRRVKVRSTRLLRGKRAQRAVDWAEYALANRGASFIIGARYIPIGRVAVNMTAGALGFPRARFVGLTALAAVSWAIYSTLIGIGAGAWLQGRPVVAVLVGVVAGTVIGLGVDWVLGHVQRRPHLRRLAQRRIRQRRLAQRRAAQRSAAAGRAGAMRRVAGRARVHRADGAAARGAAARGADGAAARRADAGAPRPANGAAARRADGTAPRPSREAAPTLPGAGPVAPVIGPDPDLLESPAPQPALLLRGVDSP